MPPPSHTPVAAGAKKGPTVQLPPELLDLVNAISRTLKDVEQHQLPQLAGCKGPVTLHEQIAADVRSEIARIRRNLEELKLQTDELEKGRERKAAGVHVDDIERQLDGVGRLYRDAVLKSKRLIESQSHLSARDELLHRSQARHAREMSRSQGPGGPASQPKTEDESLLSATSDVTEGLRRTMQLMQSELDKSVASSELLQSQTQTLKMTSEEYSTFSGLLNTSKQLITALQRADTLDRFIIFAALVFFGLCCTYIVKRRVLDKGLRVAGVLSSVVKRRDGSPLISIPTDRLPASVMDGFKKAAAGVGMAASSVTSAVVAARVAIENRNDPNVEKPLALSLIDKIAEQASIAYKPVAAAVSSASERFLSNDEGRPRQPMQERFFERAKPIDDDDDNDDDDDDDEEDEEGDEQDEDDDEEEDDEKPEERKVSIFPVEPIPTPTAQPVEEIKFEGEDEPMVSVLPVEPIPTPINEPVNDITFEDEPMVSILPVEPIPTPVNEPVEIAEAAEEEPTYSILPVEPIPEPVDDAASEADEPVPTGTAEVEGQQEDEQMVSILPIEPISSPIDDPTEVDDSQQVTEPIAEPQPAIVVEDSSVPLQEAGEAAVEETVPEDVLLGTSPEIDQVVMASLASDSARDQDARIEPTDPTPIEEQMPIETLADVVDFPESVEEGGASPYGMAFANASEAAVMLEEDEPLADVDLELPVGELEQDAVVQNATFVDDDGHVQNVLGAVPVLGGFADFVDEQFDEPSPSSANDEHVFAEVVEPEPTPLETDSSAVTAEEANVEPLYEEDSREPVEDLPTPDAVAQAEPPTPAEPDVVAYSTLGDDVRQATETQAHEAPLETFSDADIEAEVESGEHAGSAEAVDTAEAPQPADEPVPEDHQDVERVAEPEETGDQDTTSELAEDEQVVDPEVRVFVKPTREIERLKAKYGVAESAEGEEQEEMEHDEL